MKRIRKGGKEPKENDGIKQAPSHKHTKLDSMKEENDDSEYPAADIEGQNAGWPPVGRCAHARVVYSLAQCVPHRAEAVGWDAAVCRFTGTAFLSRGAHTGYLARCTAHSCSFPCAACARLNKLSPLCFPASENRWDRYRGAAMTRGRSGFRGDAVGCAAVVDVPSVLEAVWAALGERVRGPELLPESY
ncbi:hypothetical protein C8J57DRAFT_1459661 [Mycena rebaudengoi]|nr:hypothetical protein C8J57DRAFT_1459661 [Mycena rebaudengoi]